MTSHLNIYRLLIIASLALNLWIPLIIEAADRLPGSGIPEIMDGPISSHANPPATTAVAPAQTTWVDDIANALGSYFKANYPTYDFAPYLKKLTLVREALGREDRRTMKVEMGAFFKLLTNRGHGISEGARMSVTDRPWRTVGYQPPSLVRWSRPLQLTPERRNAEPDRV